MHKPPNAVNSRDGERDTRKQVGREGEVGKEVKFGMEKWTFGHCSMPNFAPSVQRVAPVGQKTSKSPSE